MSGRLAAAVGQQRDDRVVMADTPMSEIMRDLDRAYEAWREVEGRASQQRECERLCAALPDTPAGRAEREHQRLRARFSPAYFAGSSLRHRRAVHPAVRRLLLAAGAAGWLAPGPADYFVADTVKARHLNPR